MGRNWHSCPFPLWYITVRTFRNRNFGGCLQKRESPSTLSGATQPKQPLPASSQEPVIPGQPAVPETAPSEAITVALEPDSAAAPPLLGPVDSPEGVPAHPQPSPGYATAPPPPPSPCRRVEQVEDVTVELPVAGPPPAYFEPIPATPVTVPETVLSSALTLPIVSTVPIVSKTVMSMSPPGELSTEELVGVVLVLQRKVKVLQQRQRRHRARLEAMEGLVEQLRRESLLSEERLKLVSDTGDTVGMLAGDTWGVTPFPGG